MCANIMSQLSTGKSQESLCPRLGFPDNWAGVASLSHSFRLEIAETRKACSRLFGDHHPDRWAPRQFVKPTSQSD
jgi:hypothetical protein